ncbi:MAG: hypothetical protein HQK66_04860 [Desulfamplus sp.]|nr:hypothetical protein [Desulfamplus sp.]
MEKKGWKKKLPYLCLVILLLSFVGAGCGKKGDPLPPESRTLALVQ